MQALTATLLLLLAPSSCSFDSLALINQARAASRRLMDASVLELYYSSTVPAQKMGEGSSPPVPIFSPTLLISSAFPAEQHTDTLASVRSERAEGGNETSNASSVYKLHKPAVPA